MDVVLGSGWPGVMLHEAVGHGLEGDFNRKKTSAFAGLLGQMVAAPGVTVVDDGTIDNRRGSITIDDEGTPSAYNVLIENGKLVGYMQDRQNARLMGMKPTGNGRRQGYAHVPMPRMTNTYMLGGDKTPEEIISSVKKGIYAVSFGGGQVDITSGKFVFGCTEAYLIENGKIGAPIKGAMLIGNGPDAMKRVSMVGNDMKLDTGIGNCGKAGQWVPVGVGQPHLRMDQVTVGGTQAKSGTWSGDERDRDQTLRCRRSSMAFSRSSCRSSARNSASPSPPTPSRISRVIPDFYQSGKGQFWVAVGDGPVVGTIGLKDIGNNQTALRKMFVAADVRGREHNVAARLLGGTRWDTPGRSGDQGHLPRNDGQVPRRASVLREERVRGSSPERSSEIISADGRG